MYTPLGVNMETTFSAGLLVKSSDAQAFSSIRSITSTTEFIKTNQGYVNKYHTMSFHRIWNGEMSYKVQYCTCAKSEDNFQIVPFISYKFTFFQTI